MTVPNIPYPKCSRCHRYTLSIHNNLCPYCDPNVLVVYQLVSILCTHPPDTLIWHENYDRIITEAGTDIEDIDYTMPKIHYLGNRIVIAGTKP